MIEYITDRDIYEQVIKGRIEKARQFVWIATADLKDLHVHKGGKMVPFLEILSGLAAKRVELRLLHAKEPGPAFRDDFDKYPNLISGMERILCPRVHLKAVVIDGRFAYTGSANLTGDRRRTARRPSHGAIRQYLEGNPLPPLQTKKILRRLQRHPGIVVCHD
ncbi:MAG: phospholipase D-like domain-containing protein [Planctomycetota bacterium]|jgi:hypothetical protein